MKFRVDCKQGEKVRFYLDEGFGEYEVTESEYYQVWEGKGTTEEQIRQKSKLDFLDRLLKDLKDNPK